MSPATRAPRFLTAPQIGLIPGRVRTLRAKNRPGFDLIDGEIVTYRSADFALLYFAIKAFADFHLRLQFKCFDPNNNNSGVFVRFPDPRLHLPTELASRADAEKVAGNLAWSAVISGFEIQIDDNARGDVNKDFMAGILSQTVFGRIEPERPTRFLPGTSSITWVEMARGCSSTCRDRL